jgi:hypothetical protein
MTDGTRGFCLAIASAIGGGLVLSLIFGYVPIVGDGSGVHERAFCLGAGVVAGLVLACIFGGIDRVMRSDD